MIGKRGNTVKNRKESEYKNTNEQEIYKVLNDKERDKYSIHSAHAHCPFI